MSFFYARQIEREKKMIIKRGQKFIKSPKASKGKGRQAGSDEYMQITELGEVDGEKVVYFVYMKDEDGYTAKEGGGMPYEEFVKLMTQGAYKTWERKSTGTDSSKEKKESPKEKRQNQHKDKS